MQRSKIEYLRGPDGKEGVTWNPIKMRCTPVSVGCSNCWHLKFARRHAANPTMGDRQREAWAGGTPYLDEQELIGPARVHKPTRIAVQFMGDLFEDHVTDYQIESVIDVMARCKVHTFLVLTKRPLRMRELFEANNVKDAENIWAGVSVEDQETADERIPLLLQTPAARRWVSVEPMLGPVDLRNTEDWLTRTCCRYGGGNHDGPGCNGTMIDWVVCGAETGPGKRPCDPAWIDSLREQCLASGVPFFGKVDSQGKPIMPREMPS